MRRTLPLATEFAAQLSYQAHGKIPSKEEEMVSHDVVAVFGEMIPIVFTVVMFTFITIAIWVGNRRKERDAFYKSETLRRITEAQGEGPRAAIFAWPSGDAA